MHLLEHAFIRAESLPTTMEDQSLHLQQWKTRVSTFYNGRPESPPATVEVQNIQENVPKNQLILGVKMVGRL